MNDAVGSTALDWDKPFWPPLLLAVLCFLAYSNSLHNQFMLDDHVVLFGESGVAELDSSLDMITHYQGQFYRPVGHLFLVASHRLFGTDELGYHLANLVLFFTICLLFFYITQLLFENRLLALLTASLYAVHPINNALVNYITLNVSGFFVVCLQISLILFLLFLREGRTSSYGLSLVFLVFGLLSHEMSLMFPVYLFCVLYFLKRFDLRRIVWIGLPYGLICAGYLLFRFYLFRPIGIYTGGLGGMEVSISRVIATLANLIFWYVSQLLFMGGPLFLWTEEYAAVRVSMTVILSVAVVALFLYLLLVRWKKGLLAFALAFFAAGFLPLGASSFTYLPAADPIIEPHWFYFSSLGFFLLPAQALVTLKESVRSRIWLLVICLVLAVGVLFVRRSNTLWKDEGTYSSYWMSKNLNNLTPYVGLSAALLEQGRCRESIATANQGIKMVKSTYVRNVPGLSPELIARIHAGPLPYNESILTNLGTAYVCVGNYDAALGAYFTGTQADRGSARPHHYMGQLYLKRQFYQQAVKSFSNAVRLNPRSVPSYKYLLAVNAESRGRVEEAKALIAEAKKLQAEVRWYPWNLDAY